MDLYKQLLEAGFTPDRAKKAMNYSPMFKGDILAFVQSVSEILSREDTDAGAVSPLDSGKDRDPIVSNHTGYGHKGSENFEHDDTGSMMNYSGVEDDVNNAIADHEGWQEGYDY